MDFDQFSKVHYENAADNHSNDNVVKYPFHRLFIQKYEGAMKTIDDSIILPFWDWRLDAEDPGHSSIFDDFGLNGNEEGCMAEGVAAKTDFAISKCDLTSNPTLYTQNLLSHLLRLSVRFAGPIFTANTLAFRIKSNFTVYSTQIVSKRRKRGGLDDVAGRNAGRNGSFSFAISFRPATSSTPPRFLRFGTISQD
jgi:hypothetical protein